MENTAAARDCRTSLGTWIVLLRSGNRHAKHGGFCVGRFKSNRELPACMEKVVYGMIKIS